MTQRVSRSSNAATMRCAEYETKTPTRELAPVPADLGSGALIARDHRRRSSAKSSYQLGNRTQGKFGGSAHGCLLCPPAGRSLRGPDHSSAARRSAPINCVVTDHPGAAPYRREGRARQEATARVHNAGHRICGAAGFKGCKPANGKGQRVKDDLTTGGICMAERHAPDERSGGTTWRPRRMPGGGWRGSAHGHLAESVFLIHWPVGSPCTRSRQLHDS
jgi:hypothetical protein